MVKIYRSKARTGITATDIEDVLRSSRRYNEAAGVSGVLLLGKGYFVQVIEGTGPVVDRTYRRILSDARHADAILLYDGSGEPRRFAEWPLGFARMEPHADVPSVASFLRHDHEAHPYGFGADAVLALLLDFRRTMRLSPAIATARCALESATEKEVPS